MIVLDTNVLSELMRSRPDSRVVDYADHLNLDDTYLTAITVAEIRYGLARLPAGRRRSDLTTRANELFTRVFGGRILGFDHDATDAYAEICATRGAAGRPISTADAMIAAICHRQGATLATRNGRDFELTGVAVIDPWSAVEGPGG